MRDSRGSITAAAAIILTSIIVLNTVLIDYVKMKTKISNIPAQMRLACKSVLASYDSLLADKYGLYGYNTGSDSFAHRNFMEYYDAKESSVIFKDAFIEPQVIEKQVLGIMKIKTPVNVIENVLQALDIISKADQNCDDHSICGKAAKKLSELRKIQEDLKLKVEGNYSNDPACVNGFSAKFVNTVFNEFAHSNDESLDNLLDQMISLHKQYLGYNNEAALLCNELKIGVEEINALLSDLGKDNDNKVVENADDIRKQAQTLLNKAAFDMINFNCNAIKERINLLCSFDEKENVDEALVKSVLNKRKLYTNISINTIEIKNDSGLGDNRADLSRDIKNKITNTVFYDDKYVIPSTEYFMLPSLSTGAESNLLSTLFDVNQKDFIDNFDSFDNMFSYWDKVSFEELLNDVADEILIDDYVVTYMTSRLSGVSDEKLKNEIEYILCGDASCDKNNDSVEQKIIALRFILNFMNIMNSKEKVAMAHAMAKGIAYAISFGVGVTVYKYIIISVWALMESYSDLEKLIKGESVPIIETKGGENSKINELQDYTFYLRILLLFVDKETKLLRICDMIEINMKELTGENYKLSGVYNSISVKAITEFEFISPILLGKRKTYKREDCCEVSY